MKGETDAFNEGGPQRSQSQNKSWRFQHVFHLLPITSRLGAAWSLPPCAPSTGLTGRWTFSTIAHKLWFWEYPNIPTNTLYTGEMLQFFPSSAFNLQRSVMCKRGRWGQGGWGLDFFLTIVTSVWGQSGLPGTCCDTHTFKSYMGKGKKR